MSRREITQRTTVPLLPLELIGVPRRFFQRLAVFDSARVRLAISLFLLLGEMGLARSMDLPLLPFISCFSVFIVGICWTFWFHRENQLVSNRLLVLVCLKVSAVVVASTGGISSPFVALLLFAVIVASLILDVISGIWVCGFTILIFMVLVMTQTNGNNDLETILTQNSIFVLSTLLLSLVTIRLKRVVYRIANRLEQYAEGIREANRRADQQEARAGEFEWINDTVTMMESLHGLDEVVSIALLRLQQMIPFHVAAIYLRDIEAGTGSAFRFVQAFGIQGNSDFGNMLDIHSPELLLAPGMQSRIWKEIVNEPLAESLRNCNDLSAETILVVPLMTRENFRGLDDFQGMIVITSQNAEAFTQMDIERLNRFADSIVHPLQRIQLETIAATDIMTGLVNHRSFHRRLRREVERAQRYQHPLSLILLDIDHFKRVNDTYGHRSGDMILSQIGTLLCQGIRGIDIAARYGGEEMAIICPETQIDDAGALAERIRQTVATTTFHTVDSGDISITVSLGVASLQLATKDMNRLIENADRALYHVKRNGRNWVCVGTDTEENAMHGITEVGSRWLTAPSSKRIS